MCIPMQLDVATGCGFRNKGYTNSLYKKYSRNLKTSFYLELTEADNLKMISKLSLCVILVS